jgi:arginine kinase
MQPTATMPQTPAQSLMARFLTDEVRAKLSSVETASGFTLKHVIASGEANPDSSVGVYAPDAESYRAFGALLDPVIQEYHTHPADAKHTRDLDVSKLPQEPVDPKGDKVVSTRVRVGRNLAGFPFAPGISREERQEVERQVVAALSSLKGDIAGEYYPLEGMSEEVRVQLVADHFLFKEGDRFLEAAGANRDWPNARGIFHSADKRALVWVNEEDQLRIISMEQGGNLQSVFGRLARLITALEEKLDFAYDDHLGYLSSCPTNLGTAMRASVHVRLPKLSAQPDFKAIASGLGLSVRGIHGEHSESEGGVYDISNKRRLGISEVECALAMYHGVRELIQRENDLE